MKYETFFKTLLDLRLIYGYSLRLAIELGFLTGDLCNSKVGWRIARELSKAWPRITRIRICELTKFS